MNLQYTATSISSAQRVAAAGTLYLDRDRLSLELASLVAEWPKYADHYRSDPLAFAETECLALVDYLISFIRDGDNVYRDIYIGEKVKQFYDPDTPVDERRVRELHLIDEERRIFCSALSTHPDVVILVGAFFADLGRVLTVSAKLEVKVLFIGDCLFLDVIAFLTARTIEDGIRLAPTFVTSHDAVEVCGTLGGLADQRFDIIFYSPFTYAFAVDYEILHRPRAILAPWATLKRVKAAVASVEQIFDTIVELFDCAIVTHLPALISRNDGTTKDYFRDLVTAPARFIAIRKLRTSLTHRAKARQSLGQSIKLFDEKTLLLAISRRRAGRLLYRSALQHPSIFGKLVAEKYREIIFVVAYLVKRKLVVCDLDNTLWNGVIGEGLGIEHYPIRQSPLLRLKLRGVLLAINSKNDAAKVAWEARGDLISMDDFVSKQINWEPKVVNMQRISDHLNLNTRDFVFVDDRADERAMVEEAFNLMLTLDANDDCSWRMLDLWADFLPSKPGADRTEFYRQRDARQSFIAADFQANETQRSQLFSSLGLVVTVRDASATDLPRVTDLINRTNQFNMTGSRVTSRQVHEWISSAETRVLIADARDRFGTMGTISVLIAQQIAEGASIPVFVLSCRVFGYGIEFALLEITRRLISPSGTLTGRVVLTAFNQPCHDVYSDAGFAKIGEEWQRNAYDVEISVPEWLTVESHAELASLP